MTFPIWWGWGRARGSCGCVQAFSITPCSRDGRPSPEVLVCAAVFLTGPQIHIKMTDALFPCSVFLHPEQMAGAEAVGVGSSGADMGLVAMPRNAAAACCQWEVNFERL